MPKAQDENQESKGATGAGDADGSEENEPTEADRAFDGKINAALDSHLTKFKKSVERDFAKKTEAAIAAALSPLSKQFEDIAKKFTAAPQKTKKDDESADITSKLDEERKMWASKFAELEKQTIHERTLREEGEKKQKTTEEKHALTAALNTAGITGAKQRAAIALLYTEDKRVVRNDDGEIGFTVQKAGYTEHVTLEEGINQWLKTEEGKEFLPARGAGGSGAGASRVGNGRGPKSKMERQHHAKLVLAEAMGVRPTSED